MLTHSRTRCDPCFDDVRHSWSSMRRQRVNEWPYREAVVSKCYGDSCSRHEGMKPTRKLAFPFKATMLTFPRMGYRSLSRSRLVDGALGTGLDLRGTIEQTWRPSSLVSLLMTRHQAFIKTVGMCYY